MYCYRVATVQVRHSGDVRLYARMVLENLLENNQPRFSLGKFDLILDLLIEFIFFVRLGMKHLIFISSKLNMRQNIH